MDLWRQLCAELIGNAEYTSLDLVEQTGIPPDRLRALWRALGFPPMPEDRRAFSRLDIEILKQVAQAQREDGADGDTVIQLARVSGQSLARIAETGVELFTQVSPADMADAPRQVARLRAMEPFLGYIWRRHLVAALGRKVVAAENLSSQGNVLTVGFADLVGFTRLARRLDPAALAEVIERFEHSVYDTVPHHNGRVIKMLGDEVMFATAEATEGVEIALQLIEQHEADDILPEIRVGLSRGPVLQWEGDLFGPTVNLASRLADYARPSTVLVASEITEALADNPAYRTRRLRRLRLKGTGSIRAGRIERAKD